MFFRNISDMIREKMSQRFAVLDVRFVVILRVQTSPVRRLSKRNFTYISKRRSRDWENILMSLKRARINLKHLRNLLPRILPTRSLFSNLSRTEALCSPKKSSVASVPPYSSNNCSPPGLNRAVKKYLRKRNVINPQSFTNYRNQKFRKIKKVDQQRVLL